MGPRGIYVRASARAADIAPTIAELQAAGATSLRQIAAGLNAKGIPTARGEGEWTVLQVKRTASVGSLHPRRGFDPISGTRSTQQRDRPCSATHARH